MKTPQKEEQERQKPIDVRLDDVARRCFRDIADYDYIAARLAYRSQLGTQFLWLSLQAIEKYFKCMLLLNRVKSNDLNHDLTKALQRLDTLLPYKPRLRKETREFVRYLDTFGRFRYFETPYVIKWGVLTDLDFAVWQIRRYCQPITRLVPMADGPPRSMLNDYLSAFEESEKQPFNKFRIPGGELEMILRKPKHAARAALVWKNPCYGRLRRRIALQTFFFAGNSPLYLYPPIVDELKKYVFVPGDVVAQCHELAMSKAKSKAAR